MHPPQVPIDWRKTIFNMLPKHGRAKSAGPAHCKHPPSVPDVCLYDFKSCGPFLGGSQGEEHHGFRSAANLAINKTWSVNMPSWIISADVSKPFDRAHWPSFWRALSQQGINNHLI